MQTDPKTAPGRIFVRSLNILLKFARLYGYEHSRTLEQLEIAWQELQAALPLGSDSGMLLGATGAQLLLDGVPLEGSPAERQFAQLLSAAGLASIQFLPSVTQEELVRFVHAFPTGKAKPSELALQLKSALSNARGIRLNEICFVATDSRLKEAGLAAQLAAASLGEEQDELKEWLNDPQKLLELIAAAQGSKGTGAIGAGPGAGETEDENPTGAGTGRRETHGVEGAIAAGFGLGGAANSVFLGIRGGPERRGKEITGATEPTEDEILGILGALTNFGRISKGEGGAGAGASTVQEQVSQMTGSAQDLLRQVLAGFAAQVKDAKPDQALLVKLAEHLAIRFALERFERGEVKVNAVRQMLDRMNQEIESLRKVLGAHEEKMTEAGMLVESHREILDRQFWAAVPEKSKEAVLLSPEAWCIPPKNVQSYVSDLLKKGEIAQAVSILQNYAACAESEEADARKRTAVGLAELAELYAKTEPKLLNQALRHVGLRLNVEQDSQLQALVSAAFVRLSQAAAVTRCFPAMEMALDMISGIESQRPGIGHNLRPKMGIEERVPEFVEEALRARQITAGLTNVLKQVPQTAMEQLASRFNRCSLRGDAEHVANLAADLGEEGLQHLRSAVRSGPIAGAVEMAGLLSKLDLQAAKLFLPPRLKDLPRASQDRIVREVAASAAPGRCGIFMALLDHVDPLVMPLVVDEMGVTADREALGRLLTMADGDLPPGSGPYLRVKAIEALGRIHAPESVSSLKRIAEGKKMFGWANSQELRISALQALERLDPAWVHEFVPKCGIEKEDLALPPLEVSSNSKFVRQRRHTRVRLQKAVTAVSTNLKENCRLEIKTASLSGGIATISRHLAPGTQVQLKLQLGLRNLQATALMRDYRAQDMAFEIVDMNLDERGKFRRLLAENLALTAPTIVGDSPASSASTAIPN